MADRRGFTRLPVIDLDLPWATAVSTSVNAVVASWAPAYGARRGAPLRTAPSRGALKRKLCVSVSLWHLEAVTPEWERAVRDGDAAAVRALIAAGSDVDARDRYGQTGLMVAAFKGHLAVVDVLIAAGANLDVAAKYGLTALMRAVVAGHPAVAERLAAAGADLTRRGTGAPGFFGKTAADLAAGRGDRDLAERLKALEARAVDAGSDR